MSDFINGLGMRGPASIGFGATRQTGGVGASAPTAQTSPTSAGSSLTQAEGFSPTSEAGESPQDTQAGEARASEIFSAWAPVASEASPSAGQLQITGAENTAVNQVHGVSGGQYIGTQGPEAGFSGATVFSSKPPQ